MGLGRRIFSTGILVSLLTFGAGASLATAGGPPSSLPGQAGDAAGLKVSQSVQQALSGGATGTALADAVHQIVQTLQPNAKGITVVETVYQNMTSTVQGGSSFTDMGGAAWALSDVSALAKANVVEGTSSTTFSPNAPVTGAQLLTMLGRLLGWPSETGSPTPRNVRSAPPSGVGAQFLAETPGYAKAAVAAAIQNGVLDGVEGLADPNAALTRAQAVTLIINALGLGAVAATESGAPVSLPGIIPSWAHGAVALAIQLGLLDGAGGQVHSDEALTRAQMAALLARVAELEALSVTGSQSSP